MASLIRYAPLAYRLGRKVYRRMRRYLRKRPGKRMPASYAKKAYNRVLTIKKTVQYDKMFVANGTISYGSDTFQLTDIPQYASYAQIYDKYRIRKVVITWRSLNNQSIDSLGSITMGMFHSNIDSNDGTVPTSLSQLQNDSTYKCTKSSRDHIRVVYPKVLQQISATVPAPGSTPANAKSLWLNTNANNIEHYAIKWAMEGGTGTAGQPSFGVTPIYTFYIDFKDPK